VSEERLFGFDSGMSESIHGTIGRLVGGFATGGLLGAGTALVGEFREGESELTSQRRFNLKKQSAQAGTGLVGTGGCSAPLIRDQSGICVFPGSPGDISTDVAVGGPTSIASAGRLAFQPIPTPVMVDKCPKFADGATGILWMHALSGEVICLPRRANGTAFGLIRKNKPRRKPFISAAQKKQLDTVKSLQNKAKDFATAAGFKCSTTKSTVKGTRKRKT